MTQYCEREVWNMVQIAALLLALILTLSSCMPREHTLRMKNDDGTVVKIEYESAAPLQRAPYFTETSDRALIMEFNGTDWYRAEIITEEERTMLSGEVLAQSSNLTVYAADGAYDRLSYTYILDLDGTDDAYIRFDAESAPQHRSTGNDFTTSITYSVDKTETVPDLDGLVLTERGEELAETALNG